jgi:4-hydroxy-4-methyl-2-oxoglutarate aldolase
MEVAEMSHTRNPLDFSLIQGNLYSAVIADILDELGLRNQALNHNIRSLEPSSKLVGRAYTILAMDTVEIPDDPYIKELEAVDGLTHDGVAVATTGGSTTAALWGELLSTAATSKGARGAVIDGFTRDSGGIIEMGFPVFTRGYSPLDSKGRLEVIAHGVPIRCGGVVVSPGDIVFGDRDGVVIIPENAASEVLLKATNKVEGESKMRKALQQGMGIVEAYREYGIL